MADLADLYPGYASRWIDTAAGKIFARVGEGGRSPLLLLHGHPQSNVMWHRVAPALDPALHFGDRRSAGLRLVGGAARGCRARALYQAGDGRPPWSKSWTPLGFARFQPRRTRPRRAGRLPPRARSPRPHRPSSPCSTSSRPGTCGIASAQACGAGLALDVLALDAPFPETLIARDPKFFFDSRAAAGAKGNPCRSSIRARWRITTPPMKTHCISTPCARIIARAAPPISPMTRPTAPPATSRLPDAGAVGQRWTSG